MDVSSKIGLAIDGVSGCHADSLVVHDAVERVIRAVVENSVGGVVNGAIYDAIYDAVQNLDT